MGVDRTDLAAWRKAYEAQLRPLPPINTTPMDSAAQTLYLVRGKEKPREHEDAEYHEAVIRVRMQHIPSHYGRSEDDLRCVAERAVHAAALTYNLHNTRVTSVRLERIEADAQPE